MIGVGLVWVTASPELCKFNWIEQFPEVPSGRDDFNVQLDSGGGGGEYGPEPRLEGGVFEDCPGRGRLQS